MSEEPRNCCRYLRSTSFLYIYSSQYIIAIREFDDHVCTLLAHHWYSTPRSRFFTASYSPGQANFLTYWWWRFSVVLYEWTILLQRQLAEVSEEIWAEAVWSIKSVVVIVGKQVNTMDSQLPASGGTSSVTPFASSVWLWNTSPQGSCWYFVPSSTCRVNDIPSMSISPPRPGSGNYPNIYPCRWELTLPTFFLYFLYTKENHCG